MSKEKPQSVKREDPPSRPLEQTAERANLEDFDPTKHYVYVSKSNDPTFNVSYYRRLGYKVCQYDPEQARPTFGDDEFKQGDPIESHGCVLMEASAEKKAAVEKQGWERGDQLQGIIRRDDVDPLSAEERARFRGIRSMRDQSDTRSTWEF